MTTFIVRRLLQTAIVLIVVSIIVFMIMHFIPGDPVRVMLGTEASQEQIDLMRDELGLNDPLILQYTNWFLDVLQGDWGRSIFYKEQVTTVMSERLPITLYISGLAFILSITVGIPLGIIAAVRRGGVIDSVITLFANLGLATPTFWLAILGIYLFSLQLGWLPVQGFTSPFEDFGRSIQQIILPTIFLALNTLAFLANQTRSAMLEAIHQDYIRTARSKGIKERDVFIKHGLKNALIPIITLMGIGISGLVGGTVIIEQVFNIPGLGRLIMESIYRKDYVVVQCGVMSLAIIVAFVNLAVDLAYSFVDPRINYK